MKLIKCLLLVAGFGVSLVAKAGLITIESYDVFDTNISGYGGWSHVYNGDITPITGGYNYTNGSGTLNDGIIGTNHLNTHLFSSFDNTVITIYFSDFFTLNSLNLYSNNSGNGIPGNIANINIHYNNALYSFASIQFGGKHEGFDLTGSVLDGVSLNQLTFSVDTSTLQYTNSYYSISEITALGEIGSAPQIDEVPEPSSIAMFSLALLVLGSRRFRRG